ncbi:hypothetical protein [Aporhodopirellula aestuarii]|uniref:Uncharacterized protein n=1 Tax=Aporhodopirellula aestuarii TaxID=2950107 RepID=A0ABT0U0K9_9BACT|nr:hypothetical protein [Aporhodopirellula aestuarii]MCM2370383.1 hypothetical protein [Aporhodopirellula aestuarii]
MFLQKCQVCYTKNSRVLDFDLKGIKRMTIEGRRGTPKQYYTKVKRIDGKLKKEYVGRLSDPCVGILVREERLRKATAAARVVEINAEVEKAKQTEAHFIKIVQTSRCWKVLLRIINLQPATAETLPMSTPLSSELPKLHLLSETCRLANQGDEAAAAKLNQWINAAPELFSKATDALELARETLVRDLAGESAETEALLRSKLQRDADELINSMEDDPLIRHYAETVILAKMDLVRCEFAGLRSNLSISVRRYWEGALTRAQLRWIKLNKAFRQAVAERARATREK